MQEVKDFLVLNRDNGYLEFSSSIGINSNKKRLGVRIPILRKYAKSLSKKYSLDYLLENIGEDYYEEVMLKGFIIGNYNLTYQELIKYIDYYLPKITDWSLCDTFVASLKITKKYSFELWNYLIRKTKCKKEFFVRFSLVMILNYYIKDDYQDKIYEVIKSIKQDDYYIKMDVPNIEELKLQKEEVESVCWLTEEEIKQLMNEDKFFINHYEEFEILLEWLDKKK